jgi:hypothetical protein
MLTMNPITSKTAQKPSRRQFTALTGGALGLAVLAAYEQAWALSLKDLSEGDASSGVSAALEKGALAAIGLLGKEGGFMLNDKVRIPLPGGLNDAAKLLKKLGQSKRVDELITAMNRAAETAVPFAKDLLVGAVKSMTLKDAKNILKGGDTSVTTFFADKTRSPLSATFLPIVTTATEKVGMAQKYNSFAEKASKMGLVKTEDAKLEPYVTGKALDGLYFMIGEEERKIRKDPGAAGSDILKKVFGSLK